MGNREEENRISRLYADNKAAFEAAQASANKGEFQVCEKTPILTMGEQVDWDAAFAFAESVGGADTSLLSARFAAHRIAAEARGMEKAAKIAEGVYQDSGWDGAFQRCGNAIAFSIRAALNGGQHE